ncbi:MAG: MFS transporter [Thermodesulfobacteriota bacterium]
MKKGWKRRSYFRLQLIVFSLVSASFTNIYITQPVLPVLQQEFATDMVTVSFTVSAVILGIAISILPFGFLADRWPIRPIILAGGVMIFSGGILCALITHLWFFIGVRFLQGLFIPALTSCLAAYLATTLPVERLNVVMGSYVSATVLGGLGGRLLGGWIHPPLHWRYAFVSASIFILIATLAAMSGLPQGRAGLQRNQRSVHFLEMLRSWTYLRIFLCAAGSFSIFSSIFNYMPYRLTEAPFYFSTELTTLIYLVYIIGVFMGPAVGRSCNRFGSGTMMLAGTGLLGISLAVILLPNILAVVSGLFGFCTGFFTIHAAAIGSLNRRLSGGHGRANALYVLFYYTGGWLGITVSGLAYKESGWGAVVFTGMALLSIPLVAGMGERKFERNPNR